MKMLIKNAVVVLLAGSAFGLRAAPVVLAQWEFGSDASVTTTHADVDSASAVSHAGGTFDNGGRSSGEGINLDGSTYTSNEPIEDVFQNTWGGDSGRYFARGFEDTSITSSTKHFAFDVTLAAGKSYNLDNVWFDFGIRSAAGDILSVQMSDNAGFTSPVILGEGESTGLVSTTLGYVDDNGTTSLGINQPTNIQNFSWNRLENTTNTPVAISGTTYFRIYVAGGVQSDESYQGNYIDNVTVEASVIPEPGTLALVGLALGSLLIFRRRHA